MKCRYRAVRSPAVNNARALGSTLLRGEKNTSSPSAMDTSWACPALGMQIMATHAANPTAPHERIRAQNN